jgi:hypothetical protein
MIAILKMVLTRGYWRNMFQWDTWRLGWIALRRAHKDKRSRKYLRRLLLMILAPFLAPLCVLLLFTPGGAIGSLIYLFRTNRRKAKEALALAQNPPARPPPPPVSPALRKEVADLALIHAVLADRAGSENFLQTKVLPEGVEVITRRLQLDILRERGLYDRLGSIERDLMLLPDGHWTNENIDCLALALEPLRILRWVLRTDHYLPSVGDCLILNYKLAQQTANDPASVYEGEDFISIDTLNQAFREADYVMNRCFAEAVIRGLVELDDDEERERCQKVVDEHRNHEDKDPTLNGIIVSKSEDHMVVRARIFAARRRAVLIWIAKRMYDDIQPSENLEVFFLR